MLQALTGVKLLHLSDPKTNKSIVLKFLINTNSIDKYVHYQDDTIYIVPYQTVESFLLFSPVEQLNLFSGLTDVITISL